MPRPIRRVPLRLALLAGALTVSLAAALGDQEGRPGALQAGAATSNVTPPLGVSINGGMRDRRAKHIHDELHARCVVLEHGDTRVALVIADSCMIPREVVDEAKTRIVERVGLSPDRVLIAATHAHSAPTATPVFQSDLDPAYRDFLATRIADAVERAVNSLAPASIGFASGRLEKHVFNRRWYMKDGAIPPDPFGGTTDRVRMNPPRASADLVRPAGPVDPEVTILAVRHRDGRPLALLATYSLHYVGGTGAGHVSADYFGEFCERFAEIAGVPRQDPPFVAMLSNGASGDINNINFRVPAVRRAAYEQIRRVADDLAHEVHRVWKEIEYLDAVELASATTALDLGVRLPSPADVRSARAILAKQKGPALAGSDHRDRAAIYARETVYLADYPKTVNSVLQVVRIGELAVAAIPCEVFVEIGLELREKSGFPRTATIGLANGYNGYLPTAAQHALGGYETWRARSSYLEVGAADKIVAALRKLFDKVRSP